MKPDRAPFSFSSVDSVPEGLSHQVPLWYGPAVLVLFMSLSVASLYTINTVEVLSDLFPSGDLISGVHDGEHCISVRLFILCYFLSYSAFCHANPMKKLIMALDLCVFFLFLCVTLDITTFALYIWLGVTLPLTGVSIISGILGFAVYAIKILERGRMPRSVPMVINTRRNLQTLLRAGILAIYCTWMTVYISNVDLQIVSTLRSVSLLGGIGPGVILFVPTFFLLLFIGGLIDQISFRVRRFAPDISVVIPAYNEAATIQRALLGIDAAAERYKGHVQVLLVDNASSDGTLFVARRVKREMKYADVRILNEPRLGKANTLNTGLASVKTEFFIRLDADTVVRPSAFRRGMTYFFNNEVGCLGGLPLPPGGGMFDRARHVESVLKHGLYSVGLAAINGLVGVPGMFVIYRTKLPRQLGGFVSGMNGEDTEMSLRIGELGYRLIVDPEVRYISEVPRSYAHMREQRMRWFRSVYHVSSRCRAVIFGQDITFRGKVILPYMLLNSARRSMMIPLILFGLIEFFGGFKPFDVLAWQAILAVALGAPLIVSAVALIANGYFLQLLYLPEYVLFRLLRSYFTLESNLSINLKMVGKSMYADQNAVPAQVINTPVAVEKSEIENSSHA